MCGFEGCPNGAEGTCSAPLWCKDRGCGRKMCDDHKSKHYRLTSQNQYHHHHHGPFDHDNPVGNLGAHALGRLGDGHARRVVNVCIECEPKALAIVKKRLCLLFVILAIFLAAAVIVAIVFWDDFGEPNKG